MPAMSEEAAVRREVVPMNLLIVDDEQSIRETVQAVSEQCGMKAVAVATAEEALEVLGAFAYRHSTDGFEASAIERGGAAETSARLSSRGRRDGLDSIRNDRIRRGGHPHRRRRLRGPNRSGLKSCAPDSNGWRGRWNCSRRTGCCGSSCGPAPGLVGSSAFR